MNCRQAISLCCFDEGLSLDSENPNVCRIQPFYLTTQMGHCGAATEGDPQSGQSWGQIVSNTHLVVVVNEPASGSLWPGE